MICKLSRRLMVMFAGLFATVCFMIPSALAGDCGCAGRCRYCVDGQCIPRRTTYGYYQPHWRRWPFQPSPAAPVAAPPERGPAGQEGVEPPGVEDEAELFPEFPHLRKRATDTEPVPRPLNGAPAGDNPFTDDVLPGVEPPADDNAAHALQALPAVAQRPPARLPQAASPTYAAPAGRLVPAPAHPIRQTAAQTELPSAGSNPLRPASLSRPPVASVPVAPRRVAAVQPVPAPRPPAPTRPSPTRPSARNPLRR